MLKALSIILWIALLTFDPTISLSKSLLDTLDGSDADKRAKSYERIDYVG